MQIDRREQVYDELLRETTAGRPAFDRHAIGASLGLALTYDIYQNYLFKALARHGLARSSFNVLALLRHVGPDGLQLSELGELLITSRANVTGLVDHLEEKGYVKRTVDSHDRRARVAKLTKRGESLIDSVVPGHKERVLSFFSHLDLEELQRLMELLKKLRQSPALAQPQDEDDSIYQTVFVNED